MANIDAQKPGWLFILPWSLREIGGVSQVVNSLVRCFRENTEFVPHVLITTRNARTERVNASQAIDQLFLDLWSPIDKQHIAKALFSFVYRFPLRYRALHRIVIQQNIRVINAHFPGLNVLMFIALRKFGGFSGQVILSFHGSDVKAVIQTVGFERFLWKIALRDVDRITVVSNSLRMELLTFEPSVAERVTTIYNGVDLKMFTPRQNDQDRRQHCDCATPPRGHALARRSHRAGASLPLRQYGVQGARAREVASERFLDDDTIAKTPRPDHVGGK